MIPFTDKDGKVQLPADAIFAEYPKDPKTNMHLERLAPLKIRGEGDTTYTVIGSREPIEGEEIWASGSVTGQPVKRIAWKPFLASASGIYKYYFTGLRPEKEVALRSGDSGGPSYTAPDKDGHVYILGVIASEGNNISAYSPWKSIADEFNLKPIGE